MNTIGEKIREFRKTYNLSQRELCDGICTTSQLSLIENNKIKAKPEMIQLFSERMELLKSNVANQSENIGEFFLKERQEHGITQKALCYGICTVSYLSKIENNKLVPSLNIKKALYKRLEEIKNNTIDLEILELEKLYDSMIYFFNKQETNKTKRMLHEGLKSTKNHPKLHCLFLYQNYLYFDQTNLKSFLETTAIPFFEHQKDNKQLSIFYIDLATCYQEEGQFEKACLYYQKAISYMKILKNTNVISSHKNVQMQFS
ncbi:helix-turn-helix domain-containing protein [Bacillus sp. TL12]|uniref:helix-turn-helix domain-containing protein n=1 Tax=Bacillus sp. TL12 TaxID=2894756 RepID=UPI001F518FC4|nr:helix-turn-helix domain-containing protein [Bacillus sp. TL12]MCI0768260.1 helix-turn-helix domain-containing protein [Bacillus sp. TL12]